MTRILKSAEQIGNKRALPVNEVNNSTANSTTVASTIQLYYYNAGSRTSDAGQAAGTVVDFAFPFKNIQNSIGTTVASKNDTSLTFTCTAFTSELDWQSQPEIATLVEGMDEASLSDTAAAVGALLSNGQYIINYRRGFGIGKKASTASTMTSVIYKTSVMALGTMTSGLVYDYVGVVWTVGTFTEVFTFKTGGASGTTVATVTLIYTDASKAQLVSATRT